MTVQTGYLSVKGSGHTAAEPKHYRFDPAAIPRGVLAGGDRAASLVAFSAGLLRTDLSHVSGYATNQAEHSRRLNTLQCYYPHGLRSATRMSHLQLVGCIPIACLALLNLCGANSLRTIQRNICLVSPLILEYCRAVDMTLM